MSTRERPVDRDDPLDDFTRHELTFEIVDRGSPEVSPEATLEIATSKVVWTSGERRPGEEIRPAVIVLPEMPGISPQVARFARWVRDAGFTVYLPSLFGRDGAVAKAEEGAAVFQRACVRAEFHAFAGGGASPVTRWLRALARHAHDACGGPGVGAVGMCFTGNFALSMMLDPAMLAPVLCQPSLPLGDPAAVESSPEELAAVRERLERDDLTVRAYRFAGDRFCTASRFATYREALGDRFVARVLPDSAAHPDPPPFFARHVPTPHSVVTAHLIDREGEPTRAARDEILEFFAGLLRGSEPLKAPPAQ